MSKCNIGNNLEYLDKTFNDMLSKLLIAESDNLWLCLKYNSKDALSQTITDEQKAELIEDGHENQRVIFGSYSDDIVDEERTELRIFIHEIIARGRYDYEVVYGFEIIVHKNLRVLDGSKQRMNVILNELLKTLNLESFSNAIGKLVIEGNTLNRVHFNTSFQGYFFTMNNYSS